MTAPGERLTPQHARAEWERLGITYIQWPPECDFVNRVLAAWQADREALERLVMRARTAVEFQSVAPIRKGLAELDAAQGETT